MLGDGPPSVRRNRGPQKMEHLLGCPTGVARPYTQHIPFLTLKFDNDFLTVQCILDAEDNEHEGKGPEERSKFVLGKEAAKEFGRAGMQQHAHGLGNHSRHHKSSKGIGTHNLEHRKRLGNALIIYKVCKNPKDNHGPATSQKYV